MQLFLKSLGACLIVIFFFAATLFLMNYLAPLCPQGKVFLLKPPFAKFGSGFAYVAPSPPSLENLSDSSTSPTRSTYLVCENGYVLGPAHSIHAEIIGKGKGRFSHWSEAGFVFSASDNSDPNINGRTYLAVDSK